MAADDTAPRGNAAPPSRRPGRPAWLGGSAALAALSFDVDAESPVLALDPGNAQLATLMSHQSYGPRVGVPRILELLADLSLPATFFVPGATAERYPWLLETILAAGHEVGHHSHSHRWPATLTEAEERADFERGLEVLREQGAEVLGHRTAGWSASWLSPQLVAEHGLLYDSSLMHDDRPYWLSTARGKVIELPVHWSLDDWEQYGFVEGISEFLEPPEKALAIWEAELEGMRHYGCLFLLANHPFLSGRPGRVLALRRLAERALALGDVEFVSLREAARRAGEDPELPTVEHLPVEVDPTVYPTPE